MSSQGGLYGARTNRGGSGYGRDKMNTTDYKPGHVPAAPRLSQFPDDEFVDAMEIQTIGTLEDPAFDPAFGIDQDVYESQLAYEDELRRMAEEEERRLEMELQQSSLAIATQQSVDDEPQARPAMPKMTIAQMYASKRVRISESAAQSASLSVPSEALARDPSKGASGDDVGMRDISWANQLFDEAEAAAATRRDQIDEEAKRLSEAAVRNRELLQAITRNYFTIPPTGDFFASTGTGKNQMGERIYFVEESAEDHMRKIKERTKEQQRFVKHNSTAFGATFSVSMEEIRKQMKTEADRRAQAMEDEVEEPLDDDDEDDVEDLDDDDMGDDDDVGDEANGEVETQLWVAKYAPAKYTDLLSSEVCNRAVVQWLRSWDRCVFGGPRARRNGSNDQGTSAIPRAAPGSVAAEASKTSAASPDELRTKYGPEDKVILLCGPPGAGKTTLAHIAARHCGYRVMEVNASDDRSADILKQRIRAVTETQSMIGGRAPNLLVIDEIDGAMGGDGEEGAGKGAIGVLVDVIKQAKAAANQRIQRELQGGGEGGDGAGGDEDDNGDNDGEGGSSTGSSAKKRVKKITGDLKRPIICICNNLHAPALRPLLPHVKVIQVEPIEKNRLVERLRWICTKENVSIDGRSLGALADITECDIRSCLHTLQMAAAQSREMRWGKKKMSTKRRRRLMRLQQKKPVMLTAANFASMSLGQKDMVKDNLEIWQDLLSLKQNVSKGLLNYDKAKSDTAKTLELKRPRPLLSEDDEASLLQDSGEDVAVWSVIPRRILDTGAPDRIMDGLHHNYLFTFRLDASFARVDAATDWFCVSDILFGNARVRALGGNNELFAFASYVPYTALAVRALMAGPRRAHIEIPKLQQQQRTAQLEREAILSAFMSPDNTFFKQGMSIRVLVTEVLTYLCDILTPKVNSSAHHLLNPADRKIIRNLVDTLISIDATFARAVTVINNSQMTATPQYQLEPDLERLLRFSPVTNLAAYGYSSMVVPGGFFANPSTAAKYQRAAQSTLSTPNPLPGGTSYGYRAAQHEKAVQAAKDQEEKAHQLPPGYAFRAILPIAAYLLPTNAGQPDPSLIAAMGLSTSAPTYVPGFDEDEYRRRRTLPAALKEAIAHEVELEKVRRSTKFYEELSEKNAAIAERNAAKAAETDPAATVEEKEIDSGPKFHSSPAVAAAQAAALARRQAAAALKTGAPIEPKPQTKAADQMLDKPTNVRRPGLLGYFTRTKVASGNDDKGAPTSSDAATSTSPVAPAVSDDQQQVRTKHPLHYSFQEGFSNAVRRPMKMLTFL